MTDRDMTSLSVTKDMRNKLKALAARDGVSLLVYTSNVLIEHVEAVAARSRDVVGQGGANTDRRTSAAAS